MPKRLAKAPATTKVSRLPRLAARPVGLKQALPSNYISAVYLINWIAERKTPISRKSGLRLPVEYHA